MNDARRLLGVVRESDTQRYTRVFGEDGKDHDVKPKHLDIQVGARLVHHAANESLERALGSLREQANALADTVDLEELWTFAHDEFSELSLDSATDLLFGDTTPVQRLTTVVAMQHSPEWFRRVGEVCHLRSPAEIETERKRLNEEREAARGHEGFVQKIADLLEVEDFEARKTQVAAYNQDALFRRYLKVLADYASGGVDLPSTGDAQTLLDEIQQKAGVPVPGSASKRAFNLLVSIGHWHPDENLALRRMSVPTRFSRKLLDIASALHPPDATLSMDGRLDLTAVRTVTIDDPESRDFDDALSIETLDNGNMRLGIHIADPSAWLEFDSKLERAARRRGTTLYLPDGVIPMFPKALSEDLFSLVAGQPRWALSFLFELDVTCEVLSSSIEPSVIEVDTRLNYTEVDEMLEFGGGATADMMRDLYTVCDTFATTRQMEGAFSIDLPMIRARLDADGTVHVEQIPTDSMARDMVAELAVLTNTTAGEFCWQHDIPVPYRVQDPPTEPYDDAAFEKFPPGLARKFARRRVMMPASTSMRPGSHFALGVNRYVQATSPIRRYADLFVHYQLGHFLRSGRPIHDRDHTSEIVFAAEQAAGEANKAARETQRYWLIRYLEQTQEQVRKATVVGHAGARQEYASVVLHDTLLRQVATTKGKPPIGSVVDVRVERANARRDVFSICLVS